MIRKFALIFGIIFLLVGILGFIPGANDHSHSDMPAIAVDSFYGRLLGLFPVNLMHNVVHIAVGAWGVFSSGSVSASRMFGRGLAILYGLLTVLGLIPATYTLFGIAPIFGHDVWLHALSALVAGYFGFIAGDDSGEAGDA
mgnify:CR=1 FL=1